MKNPQTELQAKLVTITPLIRIRTIWERDPDGEREWRELVKAGNCFEGEKRGDWTCWQSEVEALAIVDFEQVKGSAYMGCTWEKRGVKPNASNPTISGYENQMTVEALEDLALGVGPQEAGRLQIPVAIAECQRLAKESYDTQMSQPITD